MFMDLATKGRTIFSLLSLKLKKADRGLSTNLATPTALLMSIS